VAVAVAIRELFPVKVVADVLGVARSNLIEQRQNATRPRGSYHRADDDVILAAIRAVTDARPTYGYRRVTAILNRTRRTTGEPLLNHKRVFRLMKQGGLLLQRHTGVRPVRAHEGRVIASASNQRWSSDALEITCWNGEVVRVAFAIDTHDREVIAWVASTGGHHWPDGARSDAGLRRGPLRRSARAAPRAMARRQRLRIHGN
jgi:putative transposase